MPPCRKPPRRAGNKGKRRAPAPVPARAAQDTDSGSGSEEEGSASSSSSCSDEDRPSEYKHGGYHPVSLYQLYNARYRVLCKLGAGAFSTVWLCADEKSSTGSGTPELVAMKVCKSKKSVTEQAIDEIALLEKLAERDGDEPSHVAQLRSHFWHTGPHGRHKCMAFEVMGENLLSLLKFHDYNGLPLPMVKRIARHTLLGLSYIHERGIVHTDVKLENVLIQRHDMHILIEDAAKAHRSFVEHKATLGGNLSKSQKKKMKQKQKKAAAKAEAAGESGRVDAAAAAGDGEGSDGGEPAEAEDADKAAAEACGKPVPPVRQKERFSDLRVEDVFAKVADFGNGLFLDRKETDDIQTRQYRSPEIIIGTDWDATADVWSAACMFFELVSGDFLFDPRSNKDWSRDEDHLALIIELLGEHPPKDWLLTGKYTRDFFATSTGKLKHIKNLKFWPLLEVLEEKYELRKKEAEQICSFLLPMLTWLPRDRQPSKEALSASWLSQPDSEDLYVDDGSGTEPGETPDDGGLNIEDVELKPVLDDASGSTTTPTTDDDSVSKTASHGESPVCEQQAEGG
mmetsp:Transcript_12239/g.22650  ORF Transcript_12239/g.22650 Transcript_12239/m.22650 type:complete len:569 (+) Transcript_12239:91-1797(+)